MDMVQMLDGYGCNGNGRLTNRTGTGWVRNRFLRVGFKSQIHFSWMATIQGTRKRMSSGWRSWNGNWNKLANATNAPRAVL